MKKLDVKQNTPEWLEARRGIVTGSKLKDIMPNSRGGNYVGWYEYVADLLYQPTGEEIEGENPMARGHRLETEAMDLFCSKNNIDRDEIEDDGFYLSEDDERLGFSPDGVFKSDETQEVEVKCLLPKNHLQAYLEGGFPSEHKYQVQHAFIVNKKLEKLHFILYCPQLPDISYVSFLIKREDIAEEIAETIGVLKARLKEAQEIIKKIKKDNNSF